MAKIFKGDVNFGFVINQTGAQPLDSRSVVQNYEELLKSETFGSAIYNGMTVATVDEQKVYMLIDKTKATVADGWKEVGAGGAVAVDTYAEAVVLATDDNIGQVIYVKNSDETYEKAPYIVTGVGKLQKLAASNSDGTGVESDVKKLQETVGDANGGLVKEVGLKVNTSDFETYKGTVDGYLAAKANAQDLSNHTTNTNIHVTLEDKGKWNNAETNAKDYADANFVKKDGYVAYSDAEKTKLSGVAEGAQVNVLEGVKVNDVELTIGEDKKVNIDLSAYAIANETATKSALEALEEIVNGKAESEDVYTKTEVDDTFLKIANKYNDTEVRNLISGVSGRVDTLEAIKHISDVTYNTTDKKIYLVSGEEKIGDGFDASAFIKDGMVSSVAYDKEKHQITITFNTDHGGDDVTIDLSYLVNVYTNGEGLKLSEDGTTFSVDFDTVAKKSDLDALTTLVGTRAEGETAASGIFSDLAALVAKDSEQDEEIATKADKSVVETLSGTVETKADKTDVEALTTLVGTRAEGETAASGIFSDLAALVAKDSEHTSAIDALKALKVNDKPISEGAIVLDAGDIALEESIMSDDGKGGKVEQYPSTNSIQAVLQSLNNRITAAVSGGLTSVAAGDGIAVTDVIGNSQTVSIKLSAVENNAAVLKTDGIYVQAILVDGNDMEA